MNVTTDLSIITLIANASLTTKVYFPRLIPPMSTTCSAGFTLLVQLLCFFVFAAGYRLTGNYHQMGAFASGIAALPRIVTLHDIEIVPAGKDARGGGVPGSLTLNVTAKTYRYLDEEEQATGGDGAKQGGKKPARKG